MNPAIGLDCFLHRIFNYKLKPIISDHFTIGPGSYVEKIFRKFQTDSLSQFLQIFRDVFIKCLYSPTLS